MSWPFYLFILTIAFFILYHILLRIIARKFQVWRSNDSNELEYSGRRGQTLQGVIEARDISRLFSLIRIGMPVFISVIVLGCALYIILTKEYNASAEKWAFGSVGTIIGYWLKT